MLSILLKQRILGQRLNDRLNGGLASCLRVSAAFYGFAGKSWIAALTLYAALAASHLVVFAVDLAFGGQSPYLLFFEITLLAAWTAALVRFTMHEDAARNQWSVRA